MYYNIKSDKNLRKYECLIQRRHLGHHLEKKKNAQ